MALQEIVKGMSNAAEVINDNFEQIGLAERTSSGSHSNLLKFPNGFKIAYGLTTDVTSVPGNGTRQINIPIPSTFSNGFTQYPMINLFSDSGALTHTVIRNTTTRQYEVTVRNTSTGSAYVQLVYFIYGE